MSILITLLLLTLLTTVTRILYLRYLHPLSIYPGPALASITNLWQFLTYFSGKHHQIDLSLHKKYGPVIRNGPNNLSFSSLEAFDTIYGFNGAFEKGVFYSFGREERERVINVNIFSAKSDATHREHRKKVVGPALSSTKITAYAPAVKKHVGFFLDQIQNELSKAGDEKTVDISTIIHHFTFNTMLEIIFGPTLSSDSTPYTTTKPAEGIITAFKNMSKFAIGTAKLPWFQWLMSSERAQAHIRKPKYNAQGNQIGVSALVTKTRDLVMSHPEEVLKSDQSSILKNYLQVSKDDSRYMDPEQMWRECFNLVFAGPGSTAAAITAVFFELAAHPRWAESLRIEFKEGGDSKRTEFTAVVKETLRLRSPFPTAFPRDISSGAETAIPGLVAPLPIGTVVSANTYVMGHSREIWGEDVEEWKPERWLVEGNAKGLEEKFVVFGKGARGCIGKDIAWMVIEEAVCGVLERWDLSVEHGHGLTGESFLEMQYGPCRIAFNSGKYERFLGGKSRK